jgi:hypothetical protein
VLRTLLPARVPLASEDRSIGIMVKLRLSFTSSVAQNATELTFVLLRGMLNTALLRQGLQCRKPANETRSAIE